MAEQRSNKPFNSNNRSRDQQLEALKVPPHSLEAEQSVIGGLMLDNERWDTVAEKVIASDFYSRPHRLIFERTKTILDGGSPLDLKLFAVREQLLDR